MKGASALGAGVGARPRAQTSSLRRGTTRGTSTRRGAGRPRRSGWVWGQGPVLKHPRFAVELRAGPCPHTHPELPFSSGKARSSGHRVSRTGVARSTAVGRPQPQVATTPMSSRGDERTPMSSRAEPAKRAESRDPPRGEGRHDATGGGRRQIVTTEIAPRRRFLRLFQL